MQPSPSFRPVFAAALVLAGFLALAPAGSGAASPEAAATVNGEKIAEADVERALSAAAPGTSRQQALEGLVQEALIVQEAQRRKVGETAAYRTLLRRWRQDKAIGLIGIDELRRVAGRGKPLGYKEFYPQAAAAFKALTEEQSAALDQAVNERITKLRGQARVTIDTAGLRQYTVAGAVPPKIARGVVAARTSWGDITLEELLAEEPKNLAHIGQTPNDILKMWQQIAGEIAARGHVLDTAEKAGFFAVDAVKQEEALARRQLLALACLEAYYDERLTVELIGQRVDREIAGWTATFGLTADAVSLPSATRLQVEGMLPLWRKGGALPAKAKREKTTLERLWAKLTVEQKRVVVDLPWKGEAPPLRNGDGYLLLLLDAGTPPTDNPTFRAQAESLLRDDLHAALVKELTSKANISLK